MLFVLFVLFKDCIWEWYDENIVARFLSIPKSSWQNDVCLFAFTIVTFLVTVKFIISKQRVTNWIFILCLFIFSLFVHRRIFLTQYYFEEFHFLPALKYLDLLFLFFGYLLLLKVWNWLNGFKKPYYFRSPFLIDSPINSHSEDIYKRTQFAELLSKKIQSELENKNAGALAIGINGTWGSGKTSFSNLVKEKIIPENRIVIEFNPWRSSSHKKIIEDFFELLISELQKFNPSLSKAVNSYASTLTKIDENIITRSVETITEYIFEPLNKNESYDKINDAIAHLKKQIIIFVDDLDRLDMKEIIEVLRLIRNTANFNNVVYLVSYDKEYVLEAVKDFNPYNYKSFLEKIFQFEFLLPGFDNAIIRNELKDILNKGFSPNSHPVIAAAIDYVGSSGKSLTSRVLRNKRDVLRFSNALLFEIEGIKEEVNFFDFFLIQLLKLKFTAVYKFIADHFELFFITENKRIRLRRVGEKGLNEDFLKSLKLFDNSNKNVEEKKPESTLFTEYISGNTSAGYTELEKDIIIELIEQLMKEKAYQINLTSRDYKSFVYAENFNTYFNIKVLETSFTAGEFEKYRYEDFEGYKNVIFNWIDQDKISDVLDRLEKIVDFSTLEEWEIHLKILIEIARYQYIKGGVYGINYRQIIETLSYPDSKTNILLFKNRSEYLEYLRQLFRNALEPFIIESSILSSALTQYFKLPLSDLEIQSQLMEYFRKYCAENKRVTTEFRSLHTNTVKRSNSFGKDFELLPEAEELFVSHFLSYITGKELNGFIKHTSGGTDLFQIDKDWLKTFFLEPIWLNFENFLKTAENIKKDEKYYEEFLKFYDLFKNANYKSVEFIFEYLEPSLWTSGTKSKPNNNVN